MEERKKPGTLDRILGAIERAGNKLPDPVSLFVLLSLTVVVISWLCSVAGVSTVHSGTGDTLTVTNLLSKAGFRRMWGGAVSNFAGFAPFGMVLVGRYRLGRGREKRLSGGADEKTALGRA